MQVRQVYFPDGMWGQIGEQAALRGWSRAMYVREACRAALEKREKLDNSADPPAPAPDPFAQ